ncbi:hypothetical protein A2U01_0066195, partial [Trifolium medium]|nr:hypothetical protein [Trifolium medium]
SELVEGISDLQVSEDEASEPTSFSEPFNVSEPMEFSAPTSSESTNAEETLEADLDSNSEEDIPPKKTFKYKSSHPEELFIGNKDSPRKTRSNFRNEESLVGLISMVEPT